MKERDKAWTRYRRYQSGKNYALYKTLRNETVSMIRKDEDYNRKRILQSFKGKPKRFYGYMHSLQTVKDNVTALKKENGEMTKSNKETAETTPGQYFKDMFTREDTGNMPKSSVLSPMWDDSTVDFSREAVLKKLMKLATDKSPGPDGIHPMLLKECASAVVEPLSLIFDKSFDTGTLPEDWRKAHIVPILKKR